MKTKTKHAIYGILYLIIAIASLSFSYSMFEMFIIKPKIYSFFMLLLFLFAWWKSFNGFCKNILRIQLIDLSGKNKKED